MDCDHERHERVTNSSKIYVIIILVSSSTETQFVKQRFIVEAYFIASSSSLLIRLVTIVRHL